MKYKKRSCNIRENVYTRSESKSKGYLCRTEDSTQISVSPNGGYGRVKGSGGTSVTRWYDGIKKVAEATRIRTAKET